MIKQIKHIGKLLFLGLTVLVYGCEINQQDILPSDEFVKIYNHPDEGISFYPVGVTEIKGSGFLILSGVKADSSDIEFPASFVGYATRATYNDATNYATSPQESHWTSLLSTFTTNINIS